MSRAGDRLKRLQRELETSDSSITEAQRTLADAQTTVRQLTRKKEMLEEVRNEISVGRAVIDGQRDLLASQRNDIDAALAVLRARTAEDGAGRARATIDATIKATDAKTDTLRKRAAALSRRVAAADRVAARAAQAAAAREARYRASQEELRQLPGQITAVHGRITELSAAGKTAVEGGRLAEAYVVASDLGKSLELWKRLTDRRHEDRLVERVMTDWEALDTARAASASKAAALDDLRRDLAEVERELEARTLGRDAELRAKLPAITRRAGAARTTRVRRRRGARRATKRRPR